MWVVLSLIRPRLDAAIRLAVTMMVRFTAVALESRLALVR
jgi:hypothetical protein